MSEPSTAVLRLQGTDARLGDALDAVRSFASEARLPPELIQDVLVVVDEVVANSLRHGRFQGREPEVEIRLAIQGGVLELRFSDNASPFDPLSVADPALERPVAARPSGGLGLFLVRSLTESQRYAREGDRNVLILRRSITL
jgi:anti-sigma regulatory factor (Ser/Thr protein kinase)